LGLKTDRDGEVIIKINEITGIYLDKVIKITDLITGISINLNPDKQYKVYLPAGDYQNRFFLNLSGTNTDIPEGVLTDYFWFRAFASAGILRTEISLSGGKSGNLVISNFKGQVLFSRKVNNPGHIEFRPHSGEGIYIVTFTSGKRKISKKIFFKN
jgi:hypothetical protein